MLMRFFRDNRGIVEWLLAGLMFVGSLFLPAVQRGREFNRTMGPDAPIVQAQ